MKGEASISEAEVDELYLRLGSEAEASGYHFNPDVAFARDLVKGLLVNEGRYGYQACPCRLATGTRKDDLDIICPCDYRDPDLSDYGSCYCALYVTEPVARGEKTVGPIPERRPLPEMRNSSGSKPSKGPLPPLSQPVWRCQVCGYLCARGSPPEVCPICKAKKERFEQFI